MKSAHRCLILLVLLCSFELLLKLPAAPQPRPLPAADSTVVLISVDGLASYYLDDPKASLPTIRRLISQGASAGRMNCSLPTVTWPNHTTLVTGVQPGKHGVIGNSYWDRDKNASVPLIPDPLFNKEEIVKSPTIYDLAKESGYRTAAIVWPASRGAKTLDWTVPDCFSNSLWQAYGTPSLLAEFKRSGIPYEKQEEWCRTGKGEDRDKMYVQMLNHVIRTHKPHVALLHLVEVDHVEHAKGPQSPEAYAAVKFADDRVKEVWDELEKTFPGKATLIVSSDHGFIPYQQQVQPNVLFRKLGLLKTDATKIVSAQVRAVSQGGACFIYVLDAGRRTQLIESAVPALRQLGGVESVFEEKDYPKFGLLSPAKDARMPDFILSARKGYTFSDTAVGDLVITPKTDTVKGSHGYDPNHPMLGGTFVIWGAGVKKGAWLAEMSNTDVAPTMAHLLGLQMKSADGKVVRQLLTK
jgi:predicted AlkP superfamily pyrophosphatase or phosphodiesterase